ncbi:MAG: carboxypeptidase regulatory-like domain-containing protein, partial [Terriglobales bacterium]
MRLRLGIAVMLLSLGTLAAQTFRGRIQGTVTDSTGAVVVEAKVTIRNTNTGLERSTATDATGFFVVPELPIGNYSVTVEKPGFQKSVASGVRVDVAAERRVDVALRPGQVEQVTEVTAEVPLVETTSNVLGGAFEEKQVLDLPINGRDFTKLLIMVPGAAGEPNGGGDSPGSFGLFSVNGNRGRSNNFLLDGTDMNDGYRNLPAINQGGVFGTPGTVLPIEAIAELRVLSNFESEYGRNSGSVVNIVTKSGTNDFHGSVFEYFRNDSLNARNFFNTVGPKNKFHNNQFGASIGGPIVKDRTFFYGAYEGQRERLGIDSLNNVPTLSDFADAFGAIRGLGGPAPECATGSIFDCVTAQPGGVVNPVILNLFNFCNTNGGCSGGQDVWPAANLAGTPNSASTAAAFNNADSFIIKLDHTFNQNNHLSGRYFFGNSNQSFPLGLAGGNNLPGTNTVSPIRAQLVS